MRKIIPYIVGLFVAIQALTPPFEFSINFTHDPLRFTWTFLICGVLSFYYIFTSAPAYLKILLPYLFINSFLSRIPHVSMAAFIFVTIGAYFYLLCTAIDDWKPIFRTLSGILFVEVLLFVLNVFNKETLLNFTKDNIACLGTVGNPMQFKALVIIIVAFIIQPLQVSKKSITWIYAIAGSAAMVYFFATGVWWKLLYARGPVWVKTIQLWTAHPVKGWGIGTFKAVFPALAHGRFEMEGLWWNPHNEFLWVLFEAGIIGYALFMILGLHVFSQSKNMARISVIMVAFTLMVYFPMNQNSTIPILIMFLAYRNKKKEKA